MRGGTQDARDSTPCGAPVDGPRFSVVIPVYNSASIVGSTIDACLDTFRAIGDPFEILLVNDGSSDRSWEVLCNRVARHRELIAIDLLQNRGQHTALLCGLRHASGEWIITLDDDLQNPPQECQQLISKAEQGHDLVFGRFHTKRHSLIRRLGSRVVDAINTRVFRKPAEIVLTNFRIIHRRVVERMLSYRTLEPYINGLAVMHAQRPANVLVAHEERRSGESGYDAAKLGELLGRILFNYSALPLRWVSSLGMAVALVGFCLASYFLLRGLLQQTQVSGWASVAVMLAFFNGVSLLILGILGEYLVRVLDHVSRSEEYHVVRIVRHGD